MTTKGPKILLLDIETAPNRVYVWGLFKQNVALNQIEEPGYTLCWAAKWLGDDKVRFASIQKGKRRKMLKGIYDLIDKADIIVHYNGSKFDLPILNQEFLSEGFGPPSPVQEVDLLKTCKGRFRFLSNKLDYVTKHLLGHGKVQHKGMDLWRDCMAGNPEAWAVMEEYNKRDVTILEELYLKLRPWVQPHPNLALFSAESNVQCPNCGGSHLQARGYHMTQTMRYRRLQCQDCGKWTRERVSDLPKDKKSNVIVGVK